MIKNIPPSFVLLATGLLCSFIAHAQQSVNASGGDASGSGGTIAYSIGQVAYNSNSNTVGSVSQGVQNAYEIYMVGITETEDDISLSLFPNPTVDNLILQINNYNNEKLYFELYDMQGKLLDKGNITAQKTKIKTASLQPAIYIINIISSENKKTQSFKLIKTLG